MKDRIMYIGDSIDVIPRILTNHCSGNVEASALRKYIAMEFGYKLKKTKRESGATKITIDSKQPREVEKTITNYIKEGGWKYILFNTYEEAHDFQWYAIEQLEPILNKRRGTWSNKHQTKYKILLDELTSSNLIPCNELRKYPSGSGIYILYHKQIPKEIIISSPLLNKNDELDILITFIKNNIGTSFVSPRRDISRSEKKPFNFKIEKFQTKDQGVYIRFETGTVLKLEGWRFQKALEILKEKYVMQIGGAISEDSPQDSLEAVLKTMEKNMYGRTVGTKTSPHIADLLTLASITEIGLIESPNTGNLVQAIFLKSAPESLPVVYSPTRPYVWQMLKEAILSLNKRATYSEIRNFIQEKYGNVKTSTINAHITLCTVNRKSRIHYPINQTPRIANKYLDFLFQIKSGYGATVEYYEPQKHGVWEIVETHKGKIGIQERVDLQQKLPPPQQLNIKEIVKSEKKPLFLLSKRGVIIDGNNVIYDKLNLQKGEKPEVRRLEILYDYLQQWFPPENILIFVSAALRHNVDDETLFNTLIKEMKIYQTPAQRADDFFIIQEAQKRNYYILSNDQYLNWRNEYPSLTKDLESRRIAFMWFPRVRTFSFDEKLLENR